MRAWLLLLALLVGAGTARAAELTQAVAAGQVSLQLVGDGNRSLRTQMVLGNLTTKPMTLTVPRGMVFQGPNRQSLMVLESRELTLPPKASARSTVPTLCLGSRSESPATPEPTAYECLEGTTASREALRLHDVAKGLKEDGRLPALPLPPSLEAQLVAQLAYWASSGDLAREELRQEALLQMGLDEKALTEEQRQELDQGVDNIWEAVDLTLKGGS